MELLLLAGNLLYSLNIQFFPTVLSGSNWDKHLDRFTVVFNGWLIQIDIFACVYNAIKYPRIFSFHISTVLLLSSLYAVSL